VIFTDQDNKEKKKNIEESGFVFDENKRCFSPPQYQAHAWRQSWRLFRRVIGLDYWTFKHNLYTQYHHAEK
jgi:hypothetical protein